MPRRIWDETDFAAWRKATGLSAERAAVVLGVTDRTVQRMTSGAAQVKDEVARKAMAFVETSRTTTDYFGEKLDAVAAQMDMAGLCDQFPFAHVTGMTSAIARGWTSAPMTKVVYLAQPERLPAPTIFEKTKIVWYPGHDLEICIECRVDGRGRSYRIASAERTLLDLIDNESDVGSVDEMLAILKQARHRSHVRIGTHLLRHLAYRRGQMSVDNTKDWLRQSDVKPKANGYTKAGKFYPYST